MTPEERAGGSRRRHLRFLRRKTRRIRRKLWERREQRHFRRLSAEIGSTLHRSHLEQQRAAVRSSHSGRGRDASPRAAHKAFRGWWWKAPAGVLGVAAAATLLAGIAGILALSPLRKGISAMQGAIGEVRAANSTGAVAELTSANSDFASARRWIDAWWASPAELVPGVRQQLLAVRAAASVGSEITSVGTKLAPRVHLNNAAFGAPLLSKMTSLQASLDAAGAVLGRAHAQLAGVRSPWVVAPLERKLDGALRTIDTAHYDQRIAAAALVVAHQLLGGSGPQRYFLAMDTESELRGGGGVVGNYGVVLGDSGHLSLVRFGRDGDLNQAGDVGHRQLHGLGAYLTEYGNFDPQLYWQNVLASPSFPVDAKVIEELYPQSGGAPLNGVIAIDPTGLADLLQIVGPVTVPSWPTPITAANAQPILLNEEYLQLAGTARISFLGQVAAAAWHALTAGHLPSLSALARDLQPAIAGRHLMMSSTNPTTEAALERLGAAGTISRPAGGDFFGITDANVTGDKLDYYLRRSVDYQVSLSASGQLQATATISLHNLAPATGPAYVLGSVNNTGAPLGTNVDELSVYSPWSFTSATLNGKPALLSSGLESGLHVYADAVTIPAGRTATLVVHLRGKLPTASNYRLQLFRQATVAPDEVSVSIRAAGRIVTSASAPLSGIGSPIASATFTEESGEQLAVTFRSH